jgi:hypothetical protein
VALPQAAAQQASPLTRAALLSAPLPTPRPAAPKPVLVAARIDRSNFSAMTAAPSNGKGPGNSSPRVLSVAPGARPPDPLLAMLTPGAPARTTFTAHPYGDLRSDAFTGSAVKPLDDAAAAGETVGLRSSE